MMKKRFDRFFPKRSQSPSDRGDDTSNKDSNGNSYKADNRRASAAGRPIPKDNESPEDSIKRHIKLFCESGDPGKVDGDEVLYLPAIVEAAESSPDACSAAARAIRKFLGKEYFNRPSKQYHAIMLIRILCDNPGPGFTKFMTSEKFVDAVHLLLGRSQDPSVQSLVRQTLNALESDKAYDGNLVPLINMWRRERDMLPPDLDRSKPPPWRQGRGTGTFAGLQSQQARRLAEIRGPGGGPPAGFVRPSDGSRTGRVLPPPDELAGRIEEAKTSAKLLIQLSQSTPANEMEISDLIKEFAVRCQTAHRNLQGYMTCTEPAPPEEYTFQTLIETCEQLSIAATKHQRAVLAARRELGISPQPGDPPFAMSGANSPPLEGDQVNAGSDPSAVSARAGARALTGQWAAHQDPSTYENIAHYDPIHDQASQPSPTTHAGASATGENPFVHSSERGEEQQRRGGSAGRHDNRYDDLDSADGDLYDDPPARRLQQQQQQQPHRRFLGSTTATSSPPSPAAALATTVRPGQHLYQNPNRNISVNSHAPSDLTQGHRGGAAAGEAEEEDDENEAVSVVHSDHIGTDSHSHRDIHSRDRYHDRHGSADAETSTAHEPVTGAAAVAVAGPGGGVGPGTSKRNRYTFDSQTTAFPPVTPVTREASAAGTGTGMGTGGAGTTPVTPASALGHASHGSHGSSHASQGSHSGPGPGGRVMRDDVPLSPISALSSGSEERERERERAGFGFGGGGGASHSVGAVVDSAHRPGSGSGSGPGTGTGLQGLYSAYAQRENSGLPVPQSRYNQGVWY